MIIIDIQLLLMLLGTVQYVSQYCRRLQGKPATAFCCIFQPFFSFGMNHKVGARSGYILEGNYDLRNKTCTSITGD